MFKNIKSRVARVMVIALVAVGAVAGIGAASVVTAEPAQAFTKSCQYVDAGYGRVIAGSPWPGFRYGILCYTDYSWWEEVSFPWPRDGYNWQVWQNQYCAYPARLYVSRCAGWN